MIVSRNKRFSGFTLIELMVVVSIVSLLSSVVLASLNTARTRAADAVIKEDFSSIRSTAEIMYENLGLSYSNAGWIATTNCVGDNTSDTILQDLTIQNAIKHAGSLGSTINNVTCVILAGSYKIAAKLKGPGYWCIDNTGAARSIASVPGLSLSCPPS